MSRLYKLSQLAVVARGVRDDPATNMSRVARVLVLIAEDVANVNRTGRTFEMIEADAAIAVRAAFEQPDLLEWKI